MPTLQDKEIKVLVKAIKAGEVGIGPEWGYKEVGKQIPEIGELIDADEGYRDRFISWWCRHKRRLNSNEHIKRLTPVEAQPNPPPTEQGTFDNCVLCLLQLFDAD